MTTLETLPPRRWSTDEENGLTTPQRAMNELHEDSAPVLEAPDFPGLSTGRPAWIPRGTVGGAQEFTARVDLPGLGGTRVEFERAG